MGEYVVEVKDLVVKFGDFYAVKHVSFAVRAGEIFGFLGLSLISYQRSKYTQNKAINRSMSRML